MFVTKWGKLFSDPEELSTASSAWGQHGALGTVASLRPCVQPPFMECERAGSQWRTGESQGFHRAFCPASPAGAVVPGVSQAVLGTGCNGGQSRDAPAWKGQSSLRWAPKSLHNHT